MSEDSTYRTMSEKQRHISDISTKLILILLMQVQGIEPQGVLVVRQGEITPQLR